MKRFVWTAAWLSAFGAVSASADYMSPRTSIREVPPHARAMSYHTPYPWWWQQQPYAPRVITSYVKWQNSYYERPYDAPHPNGVIGYTVIGPLW